MNCHNKFFDKFYSYEYHITDDFFDAEYDDYANTTENILSALCYIVVGIPMLIIYEAIIKTPPDIIPFSVGNYIHAQYQNIIDETTEENNLKLCNRWNYKPCEVI